MVFKNSSIPRAVTWTCVLVLSGLRCGPPTAPQPPSQTATSSSGSVALSAMAAQGKYISSAEMPYYTAVESYNEAVWSVDTAKLAQAVSAATLALCVIKSVRLSTLDGGDGKGDAAAYLASQQKNGLVYKVQSVSEATTTATLSVIAGSKIIDTVAVKFVVEGGALRMDLTAQIAREIAEIDEALAETAGDEEKKQIVFAQMEKLVEDLDTAIAERSESGFLAAVSDDTAQLALLFAQVLTKGKKQPTIAMYLDHLGATMGSLEILSADMDAMTAEVLVHPPIGPATSTPGPADVRRFDFVTENGALVLDLGPALTVEIDQASTSTGYVGHTVEKPLPTPPAGSLAEALSLLASGSKKYAKKARKLLDNICHDEGDEESHDACAQLAIMMATGQGGAKDQMGARDCAMRACLEDPGAFDIDSEEAKVANEAGCLMYADMLRAGQGGPADPDMAEIIYEKVCFAGSDEGCVAHGVIHLEKLCGLQPWGLPQEQEFDLVRSQFELSCSQAPVRCISLGKDILGQIQSGLWFGDAEVSVLQLANEVLLDPE